MGYYEYSNFPLYNLKILDAILFIIPILFPLRVK